MQKFQDIEEAHLLHMKEIIESFSNTMKEIHLQIGQVSLFYIDHHINPTMNYNLYLSYQK